MALTVSNAGSGSSGTSTATLAFNSGATWSQGDMVVVCIATDNNGTNGATSLSSVTDAKSHTYTQRTAILNDPGAAAAGVECAIYTATVGAAGMATTDQITINFSPNTTCKLAYVYKVSGSTGTPTFASAETGWTGRTNSVTVTTASVPDTYCLVMARAHEYNQTGTGDSDTTNGNWSTLRAAGVGGTFESGMSLRTQTKVVTATGTQAWTTAPGTSSDYAIAGIQISEQATTHNADGTASGSGSGTASPTATYTTLTAAATGTGSGTATGGLVLSADGTGSGSGSATADATRVQPATGTASGTGTAEATAVREQPATATGSGTGTAEATASHEAIATATGSGAGTTTATASHEAIATGTATGTGTAAAEATREQPATATASGTGSGTAEGVYEAIATATGAGSGSATATADEDTNPTGSASGTSSATADATVISTRRPKPAPYQQPFIPADIEVFPKRVKVSLTATANATVTTPINVVRLKSPKAKARPTLTANAIAIAPITIAATNTVVRHYSESRDLAEILLFLEDLLI